jgi:hypothetical protein
MARKGTIFARMLIGTSFAVRRTQHHLLTSPVGSNIGVRRLMHCLGGVMLPNPPDRLTRGDL